VGISIIFHGGVGITETPDATYLGATRMEFQDKLYLIQIKSTVMYALKNLSEIVAIHFCSIFMDFPQET
jgi:hypothetical protein